MLPFVFLAYDNGKLDPNNRFIKSWITSDYLSCAEKKLNFISTEDLSDSVSLVGRAFEDYKWLMLDACALVRTQKLERQKQVEDVLKQQRFAKGAKISGPAPHIAHSAIMWDQFIPVLSAYGIDTARLEKHKPIFDRAQCQDLFDEMKAIYNSLGLPA